MAGQTRESTIILNGRVGTGFDQIGNTLLEMGAEIDKISSKIVNFGRESLDTYKDFEFNMGQAKIALATKYGQGSKELDEQVERLTAHAAQWSKDTIFHTNDVSNAIMIAARAGMNADEIISSMPHLFELAQSGGLDLSQTLEMTIDAMKALGYSIETDLGPFADMWVYAANSSTGSVLEFGEAMNKLGAVMRFTDTKEELFSLIGLMHNMGTKGSEAATMIRTAIMRIIAPSQVPSKTLKLLGATDEELKGLMEDKEKLGALNWLEDEGFSAYTAEGELKPILTIFSDLGQIMANVAGGWDKIGENEKTINALEAIFGMRGIVGATNIISALQYAMKIEEQLKSGAAEGYGAYAQDVMLNTLYGSTMMYESKLEELKRRTGETLAPRVQQVMESLGSITDMLSSLDTGSFNALVSGLTTIAGLGAGLTISGLAFKFIANLLTPTGAIAATMAAFTAGAAALREFEDARFAEGFGLGDVDSKAVMEFVKGIGEDFTSAYKEIDKFRESVTSAKNTYQEASATFSTSLLTAVLTGTQMTPEQQQSLEGLGMSMYSAVVKGLTDSQNASLAYWSMLFGGDVTDDQFQKIQEIIAAGYEDALTQAASLNTSIHDILMNGFQNGFTEEDYQQILDYMNEYNALVARASAEAKSREDYINDQALMHKAQTASLDQIQKLSTEIAAERDRILAEAAENHLREVAGLEYDYDRQIAQGKATDADKQAAIEAANARYKQKEIEQAARYDRLFDTLWGSQIRQSDYGEQYEKLSQLADSVISGEMSLSEAHGAALRSSSDNLRKALGLMLEPYGGTAGAIEKIGEYRKSGDAAAANRLLKAVTMQLMSDQYYQGRNVVRRSGIAGWLFGDYNVNPDMINHLNDLQALLGSSSSKSFANDSILSEAEALAKRYGALVELRDKFYESNPFSSKENPSPEDTLYDTTFFLPQMRQLDDQLQALYHDYIAGGGAAEAFTQAIQQGFTQSGGSILPVTTDLNTDAVDDYQPPNKYATVFYNGAGGGDEKEGFAEGGRATTPSIFGEGDVAEWAIPEEHSARTADLLNEARAASGFTWPELLERYGGLNAGVNHAPKTLVYSPTINANDVTGVREALDEDKRRLEKWMEDKELRDEIEVFA